MSTDTAEIAPLMKDVEIDVTTPEPDPSYLPAIITDKELFIIRMKHHGYLLPCVSKIQSDY
jgi:hypothetical protein